MPKQMPHPADRGSRSALRHLPNALSLFRLACGPMLVAAYWETRPDITFCAMFVLGGLSDGADGYLARRLDLCSVFGAELDGRADTAFYSAMVVVSLRWYATELRHQLPLILATVLSHLLQWAVAYAKFGRLAAYHSVTGKLWGCSLFFGCFYLFASDGRHAARCAWLTCAPGLINNAHEISISCVLDEWTPEVRHIGHALRQQRLRRPFGFVATPATVCEWAPTGLGRSARFVFLATNVAYVVAAWSLQGWPRLGVGALAAVSTIFHSVQTGCCCLRGPLWTHRLSRCDIALASAVGAAAARSAPVWPAATAFVLFAVAIACRKRRRYNSYLVTHGLWHLLSAWVLSEAL
ncbi:unnamed protein product [Pelagomonas calceolata]|uniref:CDP-diacylglycerol--inositol 3-phosphatidyltransferase n=1 Tax=Pelagomonas calceolata TaxID=35677 RepID=A0A8J2SB12_9STRA|nr:unnamed protein product [Pelagomonas calceolata]